jgi:hypothetical protein
MVFIVFFSLINEFILCPKKLTFAASCLMKAVAPLHLPHRIQIILKNLQVFARCLLSASSLPKLVLLKI